MKQLEAKKKPDIGVLVVNLISPQVATLATISLLFYVSFSVWQKREGEKITRLPCNYGHGGSLSGWQSGAQPLRLERMQPFRETEAGLLKIITVFNWRWYDTQ